jgi:hypothetical protein
VIHELVRRLPRARAPVDATVVARATQLRAARLAGLTVLAVFVLARLVRVHGPGGFVVAGSRFVGPGAPGELRTYDVGGYDGQFVYRLALDPFTQSVRGHGIVLDNAGYRQQRIATALLAHVLAWFPGLGIAVALILVNVIAVGVAILAGTALAADAGRHPGWGLVLAAPACIPISVGRDLTEPVAWASVLCALLLVRRGRWPLAAAALTVAVLARETSLLIVAGLGAGALWDAWRARQQRQPMPWRAVWLLLPLAVEAAWQGWLAHVWGSLPIRSGQANTAASVPLTGAFRALFYVTPGGGELRDSVFAVERFATLSLIAAAAWLIWRRRTRISAGEGVAWLFAVILAASVRQWSFDVQFLRATYESWALSVLVLVSSTDRRARYVLGGAGAVTLGGAATYVAVV